MSNPYNKNKKYPINRVKASEQSTWGHDGWDELQKEHVNSQKSNDRNNRHPKADPQSDLKTQVEYPNSWKPPTKDEASSAVKWVHDKYEQTLSNQSSSKNDSQAFDQINNRKKRPDQQLYSARNKHLRYNDTPNSATPKNEGLTPRNLYSKNLQNDEKEITPFEDDSKSITSNVSTAFSERIKSNEEEIFLNRDSIMTEKPSERMAGGK